MSSEENKTKKYMARQDPNFYRRYGYRHVKKKNRLKKLWKEAHRLADREGVQLELGASGGEGEGCYFHNFRKPKGRATACVSVFSRPAEGRGGASSSVMAALPELVT